MASKRDALIASAEKSIQKGKIDAALKDYLKVLEETPTDINVLNKVGDLYVRLNRSDESIPYFTKIAEHYAKDGFFLKAIAIWKRINKIDPSRLEVYERLAELYSKQGLGMEAKSQYQVLADYHTKQNNLTAAIAIYQKMVQGEAGNIQLHVKLADLFTQARRVPEALKEYGVVAGMLRDRGAFEEAVQVYDKALRIAPDNVDILRTFVPLLIEAGRQDDARNALRRALETTPRSVPLFVMSAEAALVANDMADARNFATKAQAVEPESEDVLALLVKIHVKGRRADLAFSAAAPLADAAVRRGEAKKALTLLVPIARAAPDNEDILRKIVDIASTAGDEPATVPYRSALAEIWRKQGKISDAADALRICSRLAPDVVEYRARLSALEPLLPQGRPGEGEAPSELSVSGMFPRPAGKTPTAPHAVPPAAPAPQAKIPTAAFSVPSPATQSVPQYQPAPPAPPPPAPPAPPPSQQITATSPAVPRVTQQPDSFEFDLADEDLVEEAPPSIVEPRAPEPLQPLPPAPRAEDVASRELTDPGIRAFPSAIPRPAGETWADMGEPGSAAEAMEAFEARQARESAGGPPASVDFSYAPAADAESVEEAQPLEELSPAAEIPAPIPAPGPARAPSFAPLPDFDLAFDAAPPAPAPPVVQPSPIPAPAPTVAAAPKPAAPRMPPAPMPPASAPRFEPQRPVAPPPPSFDMLPGEDLGFSDAETPSLPSRYGVPAVPEPPAAVVAQAAMADAAVEEALVEAEVFRKYGLIDKAVEQLKAATKKSPDALKIHERLFDLYVEQGKRVAARREAEFLRARYREEGREDRIRAVEALVGGEVDEAAPAAPAVEAPSARTATGTFKRVSAAEIEIPFAPKAKAKEPERAALPPVEVPDGLLSPLPEPAFEPAAAIPAPAPPPARVRPPSVAARPAPLLEPLPEPIPERIPEPIPEPLFEPSDEEVPAFGPEEEAAFAPPPRPVPPPPRPAPAPPVPEPPPAATLDDAFAAMPEGPMPDELGEIDFCLEQGMVVDAAERLHSLEAKYPGNEELAARRARLEGARPPSGDAGAALQDILTDDLESVLDAELGRALTDEMARGSGAFARMNQPEPAPVPVVDESGLFSDEAEFFNFAEELQSEMKQEPTLPTQPDQGGEVSLEEIFREFKKGVEQQLSPEDYETHYNLGIAYKEMALTDEAIGEFQLAAKDPLHAVECCSMLGLCFLEKGLPQLAIKWYRKGLESPNIREADRLGLLYDLANVYQDVGDRENAYKTFLEIYGSNAGYRDVGERLKELAPA